MAMGISYMRRTIAATLASGLLTLGSACGTSPGAAPAVSPTATFPQVTQAEAAAQLAAFTGVNNKANAARDDKLLATYEDGPSLVEDKAGFASSRLLNAKKTTTHNLTYVDNSFFIPMVSAYPRWFMTKGHVQVTGSAPDKGWRYLLFRQASAGAPWMLTLSASSEDNDTDHPAIQVGADGLGTLAAPEASDLTLAPAKVTALYAQRLTGGALGRFSGFDSWVSWAVREKASTASKVTFTASAAEEYPIYSIRTQDGGALVFTTVNLAGRYAIKPGSWMTYSDSGFLKGKYTKWVQTQFLISVLIYVPPTGGQHELRVLGQYGDMLSGSGR
jgi:hypothetical protein